MALTLLFTAMGLGALIIEQMRNMAVNMVRICLSSRSADSLIIYLQTTNERLNYMRYPWLVDENGVFYNRFDRGWYQNILEFWHIRPYARDYKNVFDLPSKKDRNSVGSCESDPDIYIEQLRDSDSEAGSLAGSRRNSFSKDPSLSLEGGLE
jgi:hypothetical protein